MKKFSTWLESIWLLFAGFFPAQDETGNEIEFYRRENAEQKRALDEGDKEARKMITQLVDENCRLRNMVAELRAQQTTKDVTCVAMRCFYSRFCHPQQ